jgi:DNA polymerase (family 10)
LRTGRDKADLLENMSENSPGNGKIADILGRVADLLEAAGRNPFRVRSYRNAATAARDYGRPIARMVDRGETDRLRELPGVGPRLAGAIEEIVRTGRLGLLEHLESDVTPEAVFERVPGIGPKLAARIHGELGLKTLEDLEIAAHDGSLSRLDGMGRKKVEGVKDALAGMLSRSAGRRSRQRRLDSAKRPPPALADLLEIDSEYRKGAERGDFRKIAPRRFNPRHEAWLPVMHTERNGWKFTALFSNTSKAHELGKTHDWVVIYYEKDGRESQNTVVTAEHGPLEGRRVVRGRETETREFYRSSRPAAQSVSGTG